MARCRWLEHFGMSSFGNLPHCVLSISHSILEGKISDIIYLCHNIRRLHHQRWLAADGSSSEEGFQRNTFFTASCRSLIRYSNDRSVILFIYVIISGGFTIKDGSLPVARAVRNVFLRKPSSLRLVDLSFEHRMRDL